MGLPFLSLYETIHNIFKGLGITADTAALAECGDGDHNVRKYYNAIAGSVLTISSLFTYGLNTGGPGVMTVGWIIVSGFSMSPTTPALRLSADGP